MPHNTTQKCYFILYTIHDSGENEHSIAMTTYAPPKPGGSLIINGDTIDQWPIIGEIAYLKIVATLTLAGLNEKRIIQNMPPVAQGPIVQEWENIEHSRLIFNITGSYRSFRKASNSNNSMPIVA